jgi:hypothetical protein
MKVYTLTHCTSYEGDTLLGIYQYLSQAQEAEYAYMLQADTRDHMWTEIREVTMGAAPLVDGFKLGEKVAA